VVNEARKETVWTSVTVWRGVFLFWPESIRKKMNVTEPTGVSIKAFPVKGSRAQRDFCCGPECGGRVGGDLSAGHGWSFGPSEIFRHPEHLRTGLGSHRESHPGVEDGGGLDRVP